MCTNTDVSFVSAGVHFTLNLTTKYQRIWGFGGAFTDAAGINIDSLSLKTKENLMR
jgi:glucosylceramidase